MIFEIAATLVIIGCGAAGYSLVTAGKVGDKETPANAPQQSDFGMQKPPKLGASATVIKPKRQTR